MVRDGQMRLLARSQEELNEERSLSEDQIKRREFLYVNAAQIQRDGIL